MLAQHAEHDVQALREALRMGRRSEVRTRLRSFREDPRKWSLLNPQIQASIFRLDAALKLDSSSNIERVKELIADARQLDPEASLLRLETRIRLIEGSPAQALEAIPDNDNLETLCARGSILLILGQTDEAIEHSGPPIILTPKMRMHFAC